MRHSANLNPSAWAIASIILELTVDATMASFASTLVQLKAKGRRKNDHHITACPSPCIRRVLR